ncbi:MAG: hypothetical protein JW736_06670 [Deltaproteobacteria bacterium]|nr:hypothetical protein [Deltaproteobacteria bacterium]MBN2687633.1 hypothetical protein [Deltaproteobacteria bacterium]
MKVTNPEVIRTGEAELIDAITADVDWGAIEKIFVEKHNLGLEEDVAYKSGDIVVYNDRVAYQLSFEVRVNLSVLLDRDGNCLSLSTSGNEKRDDGDGEVANPEVSARDRDGENAILDQVLSDTGVDDEPRDSSVMAGSSQGGGGGPDNDEKIGQYAG